MDLIDTLFRGPESFWLWLLIWSNSCHFICYSIYLCDLIVTGLNVVSIQSSNDRCRLSNYPSSNSIETEIIIQVPTCCWKFKHPQISPCSPSSLFYLAMFKKVAKLFKRTNDSYDLLDYRNCGLQFLPPEPFQPPYHNILERLYLDSNQIRDLPKVSTNPWLIPLYSYVAALLSNNLNNVKSCLLILTLLFCQFYVIATDDDDIYPLNHVVLTPTILYDGRQEKMDINSINAW